MKLNSTTATRIALLSACSLSALAATSPATGQAAPAGLIATSSPQIIVTDSLNPNAPPPSGALDTSGGALGLATGVNGIGQMTIRPNPATTGRILCTGTLINPRTVIFAAHCVNFNPAEAYGPNGIAAGANPNGTPISFGFGADNLPAVRQWLGLASTPGGTDANPALRNATNVARALYNVEQVWYNPQSLAPSSAGFLEGDVALATLDTPAFDVPSWSLLFSPLTSETHALNVGYGVSNTASGAQGGAPCVRSATDSCSPFGVLDSRRRAVENMISVLGSLDDVDDFLFGDNGGNPQSLYQEDFDSPAGEAAFGSTATSYDFDIFDGAALPREGITAGGDSGGPLVVDQRFSRPVVAGVLSGGTRFFNGQRFSTYGTTSFYQPLFLFWDLIVANNPYVYAGNKAGSGNWEDPAHWVQLMDPNYTVERGGALVNDLPDTPALGVSGDTVKFGDVCFLTDCTDLANDPTATPPPTGSGIGLQIAGGPGSTNFVPNNVVANPRAGIRAHYYDVTLSNAGTTTLSSAVTIDRFTVNGPTKLNVTSTGSLNVLGEINQLQGWSNIDGRMTSGRDMLFYGGLLSGSGTLQAPFVTVGTATVAPGGGDRIGTLTVQGNMIMASASSLFVDAQRGSADKLLVTGTGAGMLALNGGNVVFNKVTDGPAPRAGDSYVIAQANGGLTGTFGQAFTFQGVLRPQLTYGPNTVTALLRAGSLVTILDGQNATAIAFANALDQLRNGFYDKLWNLYGNVDWMNGAQLNATFNALTPSILSETQLLQDRQSRQLIGNVSDRLSLIGTGEARGLSFSGSAASLAPMGQAATPQQILGLQSGGSVSLPVAGSLSGFVTMGGDNIRASYGDSRQMDAGRHGRYFASGVEAPFGDVVIGTAVGYAEATTNAGPDNATSKLTQAAGYAALPLGRHAYVGGLVAAEVARTDTNRLGIDTVSAFRLSGATHSTRYMATAETGFRTDLGQGLSLNPYAQVTYSRYSMGGFHEAGGETALALNSLKVDRLEGRIGARLDGTAHFGSWTVRPQVQADYVRLLSGANNGIDVSFAAAPDYHFALPLTNGGSGWMEAKGGVAVERGPLSLGLSGQATVGDAPFQDQRGLVDVTFRF